AAPTRRCTRPSAAGATMSAYVDQPELLSAMLQPWALAALYVWSFVVLSAAQLTIRLIMAFNVRLTLIAAVVLTGAALVVAGIDDAIVGESASLASRIQTAPVPMLLMALAGFAVARWVLRIK